LLAPKPLPKLGKISINIAGAKSAMEQAQAQAQAKEAVAAALKRKLNLRDAETQTVRDPEREGDIVTIWRLRPRGMESFPHFPTGGHSNKAGSKRKKARAGAAAGEEDKRPKTRQRSSAEEPMLVPIDTTASDVGPLRMEVVSA